MSSKSKFGQMVCGLTSGHAGRAEAGEVQGVRSLGAVIGSRLIEVKDGVLARDGLSGAASMISAAAETARNAVKTASGFDAQFLEAAKQGVSNVAQSAVQTVGSAIAEAAASETAHVVYKTASRIATDAALMAARRLAGSYLGDFAGLGESVVGHVTDGWRELSGDTDRPVSKPGHETTDAG